MRIPQVVIRSSTFVPVWAGNYFRHLIKTDFRNVHKRKTNIKELLTGSKFYANIFSCYTPKNGPIQGWMNLVILRKGNKLFKLLKRHTKRICKLPLIMTLPKTKEKIFVKIIFWDGKKVTNDRIYLSRVQFISLGNTDVLKHTIKARTFLEKHNIVTKSKKKHAYQYCNKTKRTNYK